MAIRSVDKMWSRSSSEASVTDNFRKFDVSFREAYQVLHDPNEPVLNIYQAQGIPTAGSSFPNFPFVVCDTAQLERVSPILTIVNVEYNGEIAPGPTGQSPSPLFAPPKIDWDDVETEEETDEDFDGLPIVTKNFEPIVGIKRPIADQTVTIRRNFMLFNSYVQARYRHAVNSDTFLGWPPGTARIIKFSASNVIDRNFGYWEITATIQFRYPYRTTPNKAWYKRTLHQGLYERVDNTGAGFRIVHAVDKEKKPLSKPVMLDADGYRLAEGATPHYLEFKVFDSLPFSALGLI